MIYPLRFDVDVKKKRLINWSAMNNCRTTLRYQFGRLCEQPVPPRWRMCRPGRRLQVHLPHRLHRIYMPGNICILLPSNIIYYLLFIIYYLFFQFNSNGKSHFWMIWMELLISSKLEIWILITWSFINWSFLCRFPRITYANTVSISTIWFINIAFFCNLHLICLSSIDFFDFDMIRRTLICVIRIPALTDRRVSTHRAIITASAPATGRARTAAASEDPAPILLAYVSSISAHWINRQIYLLSTWQIRSN